MTKSAVVGGETGAGYTAEGLALPADQKTMNLSTTVKIEINDLDKMAAKIIEKMGPALEQMATKIASNMTGGVRN
jgi:hypothetical protein